MAISNVASGSAVATVTTTLALVAPTVLDNDIMIANIVTNDNVAVTLPADWALIRADNNTAAERGTLAWKRASGTFDSARSNSFTVAGTTLGYGIITAWRGVKRDGNPIGNNTASANALADAVTYATLTPQTAHCAIVAVGFYQDDLTTAGAISGTDPTFANIVDVETATGNQASIFVYWAVATGIATGARSHTTTSTVDAVNLGYMFELIAQLDGGGSDGGDGAPLYPRLRRSQS